MDSNLKIVFYSNLKSCGARYIARYITYSASPVLKGIKPAELIIIKGEKENCFKIWDREKQGIMKNLGLDFIEVKNSPDSLTVYVYDRKLLIKSLDENRSITQRILTETGYSVNGDFELLIQHLKKRLYEFDFPHEIGLFLGYPAEDVKGFIENRGKNFILCKYWKVYCNQEKAAEKFRLIDNARNEAIMLLNCCTGYEDAAAKLKAI